jgi:beta propeller repeat protein
MIHRSPSLKNQLPFAQAMIFLVACLSAVLVAVKSSAQDGAGNQMKINGALGTVGAEDWTQPVLLHPATQALPAIDGRRVVWQDERFGPAEIFLADLDTGEVRNLTDSSMWEAAPAISGDYVVWKDGYAGIGIHGVDLRSGAIFTVTTGHADVSRPSISSSIVVWADNRAGGEEWNIYGFDLSMNREFVIDDSPGRQQNPQIDGDYVVWWDYKEHIFLHTLSTATTWAIHSGWGARYPAVSAADQLVVWMQYRDGQWDLRGYDLNTDTAFDLLIAPGSQENPSLRHGLLAYQTRHVDNRLDIGAMVLADGASFAITDDSSVQSNPAVGDGVIVWEDTRNHQRDIYRFDWTGKIPPEITYPLPAPEHLQVGSYPENQLVLRWMDVSEEEEGFVIERSQGFAEAQWEEIAVLPADSAVFTDTALAPHTTYWHRVRAFNEHGYSAYSNESFNSTISLPPNPDEQYLMVLINEARAAPEAFGYPELEPAPPLAYHANLAYSARAHSQSILNAQAQFGHVDLVNRGPGDRAVESGYPERFCSENLILTTTGPDAMKQAHQAFMDSPGHRASIMERGFNEFAVGHATTKETSPGMPWPGQITQVFCVREGVERPVIPTGAVIPYTGGASDVYTYIVNFYANDGSVPTRAEVVINGVAHPLTLSTGKPWLGAYRFTTRLPESDAYDYYFWFEYGDGRTARWPETGSIDLPKVTPNTYLPLIVR